MGSWRGNFGHLTYSFPGFEGVASRELFQPSTTLRATANLADWLSAHLSVLCSCACITEAENSIGLIQIPLKDSSSDDSPMFLRSEMGVKAIIFLRPEKFFKNYHTLFYYCQPKLSLGPIPLFRRFPQCNTRYPSTFASKMRDIPLVIYPIGHLLISSLRYCNAKIKIKT